LLTKAPAFSATAGNLLWVFAAEGYNRTTSVVSIEDTAGNVFTRIDSDVQPGAGRAEQWYAKNISGNPADVVTVKWTDNIPDRVVIVHQYSGLDTVSPLDVLNSDNGQSTAAATPSIFPIKSGEIAVSGLLMDSPNPVTVGAGYAIAGDLSGTGAHAATEDQLTSSLSPLMGNWTIPDVNWVVLQASFKAAPPALPPIQNVVTVSISALYDDGSVPPIQVGVYQLNGSNSTAILTLAPDPTGAASGQVTVSSAQTYQVSLFLNGKDMNDMLYPGALALALMPKLSQANFLIVLFKTTGLVKSFSSGAS